MIMNMSRRSFLLLFVGLFTFLPAFFAPGVPAARAENVNLTVTALGKKDAAPPEIAKGDVQFFVNKERTRIANWRRGEKLYLAVLIDDSLDSNVASQWND